MTMLKMTRRQLLSSVGAGAAVLALSPLARVIAADDKPAGFTLPKLPYDYDALEPYIDAETMKIHHDFHHQAYVNNLNAAVKGHPDLQKKSIEALLRDLASVPKDIQTAVRNSGGGHANHSMFWQMMTKGGGGQPEGTLAKSIDASFGSFDKFQKAFEQAAITRFGSGWAWLTVGAGKLEIGSLPNQDTPLMEGKTPILGLDVWEHAYYLKYRNKRPDYVKAWWNVVNWKHAAERYAAAARSK